MHGGADGAAAVKSGWLSPPGAVERVAAVLRQDYGADCSRWPAGRLLNARALTAICRKASVEMGQAVALVDAARETRERASVLFETLAERSRSTGRPLSRPPKVPRTVEKPAEIVSAESEEDQMETTEPAAEVTPAVEDVRGKEIAEMTLDEVFRLVDPEIASRKRATIRVWEAMKVARVDPRQTISRDQQEAMLVPIGRLAAHNELSEIRSILRSLGWQDRFGHSKGETARGAKANGAAPQSESNGSTKSPELAVPIGSMTATMVELAQRPTPEMLSDFEVQALAAAQTWPDGGHLPVSPHPTADADPDPLVTALQNEVERLREFEAHVTEVLSSPDPLESLDLVMRRAGELASQVPDLQNEVERLKGENESQERQMQHLAARCSDAERRADELKVALAEMLKQSETDANEIRRLEAEVKYARRERDEAPALNAEMKVQPPQSTSLTLILMELLADLTTTICELWDKADRESVSASDCVAAMVSAFVRTARREVGA